ncbi:murein hydrolase activator EnvC family protein [Halioxenophilus sp. WMMB6]|uniref:murein hydrolase activator EnvC family protein n=1 Tax=Halioxenophilus sp. WMMB6 TaxID=3073815 RepID=UPI00295F0BDD|nr:peptidoglycan DD-metalloendopeptidase family protein [Halioxenophilus sp. WMMB6]
MLRKYLLPLLALAVVSAHADEASEYQAKLTELKQLIEQLQTQLKEVKGTKDSLTQQLATSETEIGDLTQKIRQLEQELAQQKKRLALLHEQRDQLQSRKAEQSQAVADQLASAYKLGNQSQLKALLNIDDSQQVARILRYHEYIVRARSEKISEYRATVSELDQVSDDITVQASALEQQAERLKERQARLKSLNRSRQQTIARLDQESQTTERKIAKLGAERKELQQLLEQVSRLIVDIPIPSDLQPIQKLKGKLAWPVKGRIKYQYGSLIAGGPLTWDGALIEVSAGTEVNAIHGGRVVFSDWLRGQGLLLIIDHGNGYVSLYGHNQTLYKEVGDWVKAGEVIALAGASGGQKQAGLYFEIRHNNEPQNPKLWCKG